MTLRYLLDTSVVWNPASRTPDRQLLERLDADGPVFGRFRGLKVGNWLGQV